MTSNTRLESIVAMSVIAFGSAIVGTAMEPPVGGVGAAPKTTVRQNLYGAFRLGADLWSKPDLGPLLSRLLPVESRLLSDGEPICIFADYQDGLNRPGVRGDRSVWNSM